MNDYLENLNDEQLKAVKRIDGPTLVLAGAGTGKTTTIVSRVFHLIENGVKPENILLMTFTNKASHEILQRISAKLNVNIKPPFIGTFHKFGHFFLTKHFHLLKNRTKHFRIVEANEIKNIIIKIIENDGFAINLGVEEAIKRISHLKNANIQSFETDKVDITNKDIQIVFKVYREYDKVLLERNLIDLDDLQILTYKLLKEFPDLRAEYSQQFQYIMIDEFQDTNVVQYETVKLLLKPETNNIFVVGDDDQSIYGWRGAEIENILNFDEAFPNVQIITLNRNYRSTSQIISASNHLISKNVFRREKNIIANNGAGESIELKTFADDMQEAEFVVSKIQHLISNKIAPPSEIAILYRVNALSFHIENALKSKQIQYSIKGTKTTYTKPEVQEVIKYLNVLIDPDNNNFFFTILEQTQGIGEQSINIVLEESLDRNISLYETLKTMNLKYFFKTRSRYFTILVEKIDQFFQDLKPDLTNLAEVFEDIFEIKEKYRKKLLKMQSANKSTELMKTKLENIDAFYILMNRFFKEKQGTIDTFINLYSINEDDRKEDKIDRKISLVSIHLSKGLEFKHVFVIGLNHGFLPSYNNADSEEERRLAYVAFTRAKEHLYLTSTNFRTLYGKRQEVMLSQYLYEANLLSRKFEPERDTKNIKKKEESRAFNIGNRVEHMKFGCGIIIDIDSGGKQTFLTIEFQDGKIKKIISRVIKKR